MARSPTSNLLVLQVSTAMVEPYNSFLFIHMTLDHSHCAFMVTKEAFYDIGQRNLDIIHTNLYRLIGQVVSIIITSLQVDSTLNVNLTDFPTDLIPYPHIYFPRATYSEASPLRRPTMSSKITNACLKPATQMAKYDSCHSKYVVCGVWCWRDKPTSTQPLPATG
ncbi:tubulin alpha-1 chain-like [Lontra canadensis]|uniref:tubulin alpha-1 chain-like n=1 Tax=Lontra canadensis TaxID=76717 RepID=UPI0013F2E6D3|nr:tubulin alpha-1 chain-like [Lontra canadensis]